MPQPYQIVAHRLAGRVRSGSYPARDPLPNRFALAREYGVSRATLDKSIRLLEQQGLLRSIRGRGTFVRGGQTALRIAIVGRESFASFYFRDETVRLEYLPLDQVRTPAERERLARFDALVWYCPPDEAEAWIRGLAGGTAQVVVNREWEGVPRVSTDHFASVHRLSARRLEAWPEAVAVFLTVQAPGHPSARRREGFVRACREAGRYHEVLILPPAFAEKKAMIADHLQPYAGQPLLLVSDSAQHTGAVIAWANEAGRRWREDLLYSDFDNTQPEHVWGLRVSTLLQSTEEMTRRALEMAKALAVDPAEEASVLLPARFEERDT